MSAARIHPPGSPGAAGFMPAATSARSEDPALYVVTPAGAEGAKPAEDQAIAYALKILRQRLKKPGPVFDRPQTLKDYLTLRLAALEHELFTVLFLDGQHRLIECEEMFRGTLTQASVYPREVVKAALRHNAGAVVLAHNHPSGVAEPSRADEFLTQTIKAALQLVDVRVLDHLIVGSENCVSFAERGML
jgi:DNA repair protein RadC